MHRNARLTPAGRLMLCQRIEAGWPVAHAAAAMGISRDRAYVWWRRYQEEGRSARGPLEPAAPVPRQTARRSSVAFSRCARARSRAGPHRRDRRAPSLDGAPGLVRRGLNRLDHLDRATRFRSDASRCAGPASSSTSTSRSWAKSPEAGVGGFTAGRLGRAPSHPQGRHRLRLYPLGRRRLHPIGLLRSARKRAGRHGLGFWHRARCSSLPTGSRLSASSPTTALVIARRTSPARSVPSSTPSPVHIVRPRTARLRGSTALCSSSGPTPVRGAQKASGPERLTAGSTSTTITGTTPPSGDLRSAVSATWLVPTPSCPPI